MTGSRIIPFQIYFYARLSMGESRFWRKAFHIGIALSPAGLNAFMHTRLMAVRQGLAGDVGS